MGRPERDSLKTLTRRAKGLTSISRPFCLRARTSHSASWPLPFTIPRTLLIVPKPMLFRDFASSSRCGQVDRSCMKKRIYLRDKAPISVAYYRGMPRARRPEAFIRDR